MLAQRGSVSLSAVSVTLGDDFESLDGADDVLVGDTLLRKGFVEAFLFLGQFSAFGLFEWQDGVGVVMLRTLIA